MTASTWYVTLSVLGIVTPLIWALIQLRSEPARSVRVTVPIVIAIISTAAFSSGRVASSQQSRQLEKLKPRYVSGQQRAELKQRFPKRMPPIRIKYRLMDGEGKDYSEMLAAAIRGAGGTVLSVAGGSLADLRDKVTVVVNSGDANTLMAADQLCNVLTAIAIACGGDIAPGQLDGSPSQGEILLVVGRKG